MSDVKPQSNTKDDGKSQSTLKLGLWLTFAAFIVIILVFNKHISEIKVGSEGVSAKMLNTEDATNLTPEDKQNGADALTKRVSALEQQAKANPAGANAPVAGNPPSQPDAQSEAPSEAQPQAEQQQPSQTQFTDATYQQQPQLPNIGGYWSSASGAHYQVNQYGNYVSLSEYNLAGMVDAVATGQIGGWGFSLPGYNLAGRAGVLYLQVSADQRQMSGSYRDVMTGATVQMQLYR
jgi:hypothetical protein